MRRWWGHWWVLALRLLKRSGECHELYHIGQHHSMTMYKLEKDDDHLGRISGKTLKMKISFMLLTSRSICSGHFRAYLLAILPSFVTLEGTSPPWIWLVTRRCLHLIYSWIKLAKHAIAQLKYPMLENYNTEHFHCRLAWTSLIMVAKHTTTMQWMEWRSAMETSRMAQCIVLAPDGVMRYKFTPYHLTVCWSTKLEYSNKSRLHIEATWSSLCIYYNLSG